MLLASSSEVVVSGTGVATVRITKLRHAPSYDKWSRPAFLIRPVLSSMHARIEASEQWETAPVLGTIWCHHTIHVVTTTTVKNSTRKFEAPRHGDLSTSERLSTSEARPNYERSGNIPKSLAGRCPASEIATRKEVLPYLCAEPVHYSIWLGVLARADYFR